MDHEWLLALIWGGLYGLGVVALFSYFLHHESAKVQFCCWTIGVLLTVGMLDRWHEEIAGIFPWFGILWMQVKTAVVGQWFPQATSWTLCIFALLSASVSVSLWYRETEEGFWICAVAHTVSALLLQLVFGVISAGFFLLWAFLGGDIQSWGDVGGKVQMGFLTGVFWAGDAIVKVNSEGRDSDLNGQDKNEAEGGHS